MIRSSTCTRSYPEGDGRRRLVPPSWSLDNISSRRTLGGAIWARRAEQGRRPQGEVFGYRNLFVIDGAIVPEAVGVNPSRSIAALAERAVGLIVTEGR